MLLVLVLMLGLEELLVHLARLQSRGGTSRLHCLPVSALLRLGLSLVLILRLAPASL